jgi:hypothetical protein
VFGSLNFSTGDTFKIYKVSQAIDQPGRARGSLITGDLPVKPAGWNDQRTEPCYAWNNVAEGKQVGFGQGDMVIRPGEHYFNNTPMPGYTPYIYPHPLVKGVAAPEQMTRNAKKSSERNLRKTRQPWGGKKLNKKQAQKASENSKTEMAEGQDDQ